MPRLNKLKLCSQIQMVSLLRQTRKGEVNRLTTEEYYEISGDDVGDRAMLVWLDVPSYNLRHRVLVQKAVELWLSPKKTVRK